jgi:hypothetical protein
MDRAGTLPDRCVACNQPAGGYRLRRNLYSSPLAWKLGAFATPFAVMFLGLSLDVFWMAAAFWPLVIVLLIAHVFVRRSLKLEIGVCTRHRLLRYFLLALAIACMCGVGAGIIYLRTSYVAAWLLLGSILGLLVLIVLQSTLGAQAVKLKSLSAEHAWLSGTGEPFRSGLPELN